MGQNHNQQDLLVSFVEQYRAAHGNNEHTVEDVASFIINARLWEAPPESQKKELRRLLSTAMNKQRFIAPDGTIMRKFASVKRQVTDENGKQIMMTFWQDVKTAPHQFMVESYGQRRDGIVKDAYRLKIDIKGYNANFNNAAAIQLELNLTNDVIELEAQQNDEDDDDGDLVF